jgi:hypothetical protein
MKSAIRREICFTAGISLFAALVLLASCGEKQKTGPIIMGPEKSPTEVLELHPEQKQLLDRLVMMSPVLNRGPIQKMNPQWTALASEFTGKYMNEWKNPEALKRYAGELDRKDQAALRTLGEYFRLALCGSVLGEDTCAGKREALRGLIELVKYEGEAGFWNIIQDKSGSCVDSPSLGLLETALPDAGIALDYDWKPAGWYEKVYEQWLAWWKENHSFLIYDRDRQVYIVSRKARESGKPVNPVSGEEMTPEEIKAYDTVLARILDWIKNTALY